MTANNRTRLADLEAINSRLLDRIDQLESRLASTPPVVRPDELGQVLAAPVVRCRRLEIVDINGAVRASIHADMDGVAALIADEYERTVMSVAHTDALDDDAQGDPAGRTLIEATPVVRLQALDVERDLPLANCVGRRSKIHAL